MSVNRSCATKLTPAAGIIQHRGNRSIERLLATGGLHRALQGGWSPAAATPARSDVASRDRTRN
jgi:hypothetical protein